MSERLTAQEIREFRRCVSDLNRLITNVRQRIPDAQYYLDGSCNLNLMSGDSHTGVQAIAHPERIMASETLYFSDGGDW